MDSSPHRQQDSDLTPENLRRSPRIQVNREFASIDAFLEEYVTNISRDGVFIRTDEPYSIGTRVNLRFSIILEEVETIEGLGEVVRIVDDPSTPKGMGVVFVDLDSVSEKIIQRLFIRQSSGHGSE